LTDSQSNEIREKQDSGASQREIAKAINEKQKENGF
jgi:IS30 family transposase